MDIPGIVTLTIEATFLYIDKPVPYVWVVGPWSKWVLELVEIRGTDLLKGRMPEVPFTRGRTFLGGPKEFCGVISLDVTVDNISAYSGCLLYTSPSPRDATLSRMPSSA